MRLHGAHKCARSASDSRMRDFGGARGNEARQFRVESSHLAYEHHCGDERLVAPFPHPTFVVAPALKPAAEEAA